MMLNKNEAADLPQKAVLRLHNRSVRSGSLQPRAEGREAVSGRWHMTT